MHDQAALSSPPGVVSHPHLQQAARRLRTVSLALEAGVFALVAGSAAAFGSVHPPSYTRVWLTCLALGALVAVRAFLAASLRRALGTGRLALDADGRWSIASGEARLTRVRWSTDLGGLARHAPLLLPGLCFAAWVAFQLVPLPPGLVAVASPDRAAFEPGGEAWLPLTLSPPETRRGLAFLGAALLAHLAAAAAFASPRARMRFLRGLSWLGLAFAVLGLVQLFLGTTRIYGVFEPLEGGGSIFGPFVNRNHFAGYMVVVIPVALGVCARAYQRWVARMGREHSVRTVLEALDSREGTALLLSGLPVLAATAGLLATQSRGGLLGLLVAMGLLSLRRRRGWILWVAALALALAWSALGLERLLDRLARVPVESQTRTLVWQDSLERSRSFRVAGTGYNTFATALSRSEAWSLPEGATPWPTGQSPAELLGPDGGVRSPARIEGNFWYREAHNDYLQVLIEVGVPGLLLALWAATAALRGAARDLWIMAGLAGVLVQEFVDFGLQIPALALLFVTLAAAGTRGPRHGRAGGGDGAGSRKSGPRR